MGASTIWSYIELFGHLRLAKAVFVDQAPLQVKTDQWSAIAGSHDVTFRIERKASLLCTLWNDCLLSAATLSQDWCRCCSEQSAMAWCMTQPVGS